MSLHILRGFRAFCLYSPYVRRLIAFFFVHDFLILLSVFIRSTWLGFEEFGWLWR